MTHEEKLFMSVVMVCGMPPVDSLDCAGHFRSFAVGTELREALEAEQAYWKRATVFYIENYPQWRLVPTHWLYGRAITRMHMADSLRYRLAEWVRTERLLTKYFG